MLVGIVGYLVFFVLAMIVVVPSVMMIVMGLGWLDPEDAPRTTAGERGQGVSRVRRMLMALWWVLQLAHRPKRRG